MQIRMVINHLDSPWHNILERCSYLYPVMKKPDSEEMRDVPSSGGPRGHHAPAGIHHATTRERHGVALRRPRGSVCRGGGAGIHHAAAREGDGVAFV